MRAFAVRNFGEAPALYDLPIPSADGARRVALIAEGLDRAERGQTGAVLVREEARSMPPTPPTDGGTPSGSSNDRGQISAPRRGRPAVLRLTPAPKNYELAERKVRRVLAENPNASIKTLARAAKVSESTASKYRRLWEQEHPRQAQEDAPAPVAARAH